MVPLPRALLRSARPGMTRCFAERPFGALGPNDTLPSAPSDRGVFDPPTHLDESLGRIRIDENGGVFDLEHAHIAAPLQELARSRVAVEICDRLEELAREK